MTGEQRATFFEQQQVFLFGFGLGFVELDGDDREREVDEEEGADEYDRHEVDPEHVVEGALHVHHDLGPALQRGHDVDHEERAHDVVEARDAEVRVFRVLRAGQLRVDCLARGVEQRGALRTGVRGAEHRALPRLDVQLAGGLVEAGVLQQAREQLQPRDREDEECEHEHGHDLEEVGDRAEYRDDQRPQLLDGRDRLERPQHSQRPEAAQVDAAAVLAHHERQVARSHDDEVEHVPDVAQVGAPVEEEAHGEDLEHQLDGVEVQEDRPGLGESALPSRGKCSARLWWGLRGRGRAS